MKLNYSTSSMGTSSLIESDLSTPNSVFQGLNNLKN